MPIYTYECGLCGEETEEYRSVTDQHLPEHCGQPMKRTIAPTSFAFKTRGGNLMGFSGAHGAVTKGNRKPKTIGRGHGLGGRRKPPSIRDGLVKKPA